MEVRTIDYVVPMVFHDDEQWQEDFRRVNARYDENNPYAFVVVVENSGYGSEVGGAVINTVLQDLVD